MGAPAFGRLSRFAPLVNIIGISRWRRANQAVATYRSDRALCDLGRIILTQIKVVEGARGYACGIEAWPTHDVKMHREFTIKPLTSWLVQKAYPFAQSLGLHDISSWRAFVESYVAPGAAGADAVDSGVIAAENLHGYVCGLLFYQVNRHNKDGAALICDPFLVADLPRYETPVRALLDAADRIALDRDCKWVRVVLPATGDPLNIEGAGCEGALFRAGYALESLSFRRRRALPVRKVRMAPALNAGRKTRTLAR